MEAIRSAMEWAAFALATLGVVVIVVGTAVAVVRCRPGRSLLHPDRSSRVTRFRHQLVNSLLLGLDMLVASDIIHTAAIEPTLRGVATLGLLVVVRVVLTWSLIVEVEGRWPWQPPRLESGDVEASK